MIRTRLTFWNAVVLSLVLTGLGTTLFVTIRAIRYTAVDTDLRGRAKFFHQMWWDVQRHHITAPPRSPIFLIDRSGDEKLAKHIELEMKLGHPRILSSRGKDLVDPTWRTLDPEGLLDAAKGRVSFDTIDVDGIRARVYSVPIVSKSHVVAVGQLATPLDALDQEISALGHTLLLMLPLAIIATSLTGIGLTHYMMRPVREIARAASQIESTNLSGRLSVRGSDEFAELATTFNGMLGRLDQSFQDLETAFVAQRRFAADASHELKTPLTAIKARVGVALRGECSPEKTREHVIAIGAAADSMSTIVRDLLFLSVSDEGRLSLELSQFFLLSCVLEAIESLRPLDSRPIELRVPANLEICADEKLLRRVLVNLLENAARHTPGDRTIGVEAKRRGHQFLLRVYDTGEGISAEDLAHVFERMFRVDSSRNRDSGGAGLGLAIVKSIVDAHGGSVSIESRIDAGTSVNILLPREPSTESFLA